MQTIVGLIQKALPELKQAEQRVADYVLENVGDIVELTITELADRAETSEPTVIRFCRKIGLKGYTDLRLGLARDIPVTESIRESVTPDDSPVNILHKMFRANIEALNKTLPAIDSLLFEKGVEFLATARRISFYAFGGSGSVIKDAHHKFTRLGVPCQVHTDAHMQFMDASLLKEGDVVVAVSLKGSTKDLVESVNIARKNGAIVIGIIGRKKSPLGKACDLSLTVDVDEVTGGVFPMAARLTQVALIDVLYMAVTMRNWEGVKDNLQKVKDTLSHRNY